MRFLTFAYRLSLLSGILLMEFGCSKSSSGNGNPSNTNSAPSPGDIAVSLTLNTAPSAITIPSDFEGLSFETSSLPAASYFTTSNTVFINLIKGLGNGVIRIGGNSVDRLHWTGQTRSAGTGSDSLTTDDADRFFSFAAATGWKVMFGLNLGSGSAAVDATEAGYLFNKYASQLRSFEIGNEPDLYSHNGWRSSSYTFGDFKQEFDDYYDTIKKAVPGALFSGPAAASNTTTWVVPFAKSDYAKVNCITQHYYKMGPPSNPAVTITALLNGNSAIITQASAIAAAASANGLPYRIAECNSVYDGGAPGVSNTLASALWGLDYMFTLAEQGASGVNFHGGGAGAYTPIAWSSGAFSARPLYYGLLMFGQGIAGANVLSVSPGQTDSLNLTAHAVMQPGGTFLVCLINKDLFKEAYVSLNVGRHIGSATTLRLTGPAPDSTSGILLGGTAVNSDGIWTGAQTENALIAGNICKVKVPAYSAVLITIK